MCASSVGERIAEVLEVLDGGGVQLEEVLEESWEGGVAWEGSEEGLEEWREEGAAPVGSEEGVVPAEWREKMLQQGMRKELF